MERKRLLAIWLSGLFTCGFLAGLFLLIAGISINIPQLGWTWTAQMNLPALIIEGVLAVALFKYGIMRLRKRPRKKVKRKR